MSTVPFPVQPARLAESQPEALPAIARKPAPMVRRRGTIVQGRALETLGHAVEYLVDSGLFRTDLTGMASEQEAIQLLMKASRAVFLECPEVLPMGRRAKLCAMRVLRRVSGRREVI